MSQVLLLDHSCDLAELWADKLRNYQLVICLFWAAPETLRALSECGEAQVLDLRDVVGKIEDWHKRTYELTQRVCSAGPQYHGIPWRDFLTESFYYETRIWQVVLNVHGLIERWAASEPVQVDYWLSDEFEGYITVLAKRSSATRILYRSYSAQKNSRFPVLRSHISFWLNLAREAQLTRRWSASLWSVLEALDKQFWLRRAMSFSQPRQVPRDGITFFSSYLNNSRNLRAYESSMPGPVNWVLTNYYARDGAMPSTSPMTWLWQYAPGTDSKQGVDFFNQSAGSSEISSFETELLSGSRVWKQWQSSVFRLIVQMTRFWESYLDHAQPRLVVMASRWGIEGWFTHLTRQRGIPVLHLMHGLYGSMIDFRTPLIADGMVVYGEFWRELLPQPDHAKIVVFNPTQHLAPMSKKPAAHPRLTFFSAPLTMMPFNNWSELGDGMIRLLQRIALHGQCQVHVRAHPRENPHDLLSRWQKLYGAMPANVHIGKHQPLNQIIAETDVAIMFHSTVMLNCLAAGIPIVMPAWFDLGWNEGLKKIPSVHLANDFADMERCASNWLATPPETMQGVSYQFVRAAGEGHAEWSTLLRQITSNSK